jgi:hypothetical protein
MKPRKEFTEGFDGCESYYPYMVVTDTLNCQKELEGLVDMEEVWGTGRCLFGPNKNLEAK